MPRNKKHPSNPAPVMVLRCGETRHEVYALMAGQLMDWPGSSSRYFCGPSLVVKSVSPYSTNAVETDINDASTWQWIADAVLRESLVNLNGDVLEAEFVRLGRLGGNCLDSPYRKAWEIARDTLVGLGRL